MLLDTISQFTNDMSQQQTQGNKQENQQQGAQKFSEINDPSNHYQYANFEGTQPYYNSYTPMNNIYNTIPYQNQVQFLQKPQKSQNYIDKKDRIRYPKTPITAGINSHYFRSPSQKNFFKMQREMKKGGISKRNRIYSPLTYI